MDNANFKSNYEEDYTFRKALADRKADILFLWKNKLKFIPVVIGGVLLGLFLAWYVPITYSSRITFVVDDTKTSGGGSMLSALAGQFGFDVGGVLNSGGVLAGDNVQQLLKSEKLIKETLLSLYGDERKDYTLADRYAEAYKLKKKWRKHTNNDALIMFPSDRTKYNRLQDSLLQDMTTRILKSNFSVSKPDKKLTFFEASATMRDEKLAQLFCTRLITASTNFYIQTKTKKLRNSVELLQTRKDSIEKVLTQKTYSAATANQILLDANPAYPTTNVSGELQSRDKMVLSTIYAEVVKNLEASKTMLMQETPAIQIVDVSEYPLKKNRLKYLRTAVLGALSVSLAFAAYLLIVRRPVNS